MYLSNIYCKVVFFHNFTCNFSNLLICYNKYRVPLLIQLMKQTYTKEKVYDQVKKVIVNNKQSDLFHKGFLKPIQIALKTKWTQNDKKAQIDALPYGLKQVIKPDISLNNYVLQDFESYDQVRNQKQNIKSFAQSIQEKNLDNLISLIKPEKKKQAIEMAICICMYSQNKLQLRKTLAGVANNIATFVNNGISADDIAVCVIIDGIEKVDPSVVTFFEEMQKQSNIYFDDEVAPMQADELAKSKMQDNEQQQAININNFIFDELELADRKNRRFIQRKKQYQTRKHLLKKIDQLQKRKNLTYYDLDDLLKPFFINQAKQQRRRQFAKEDQQYTDEDLLRQYADNIRKGRPLIQSALGQARADCKRYIQSRNDLALLNAYRTNIQQGSISNRFRDKKQYKQEKNGKNYQKLPQKQPNSVNMNLFIITKYKNMGKLSSHNWFFNGFCKEVKCRYSVLLDVGLTPGKNSLYKMYKYMDTNSKCGGVCGYMNLRMESLQDEDQKVYQDIDCFTKIALKFADIQRAQQVQYHFGHLIDKSFESMFKFIHVLPGAFSAYKMKALIPSMTGVNQGKSKVKSKSAASHQLMKDYFKSLDESTSDVRLKRVHFTPSQVVAKVLLPDMIYNCCYQQQENTDQELLYDSNVYLAEDRTLCLGIHKNGYNLQYLPDAHGWVDPIKTLPGLLGQRKRWINGSFFAFQKVRKGFKSEGGANCMLKLQILYLAFMNMFAFVAPALFLFTVHLAMFAFRDWALLALQYTTNTQDFQTTEFYNAFVYIIDFIYVMIMLSLIFFSIHFTHRNQKFIPYIYAFSTFFGVMAIIVFVVLLFDMIKGLVDNETFLVNNQNLRKKFFAALPGGQGTFLIYKYMVVAVLALYTLPILFYSILYHRLSFLFQVLFGAFAFVYYSPTYLNILNTFALCRIDDISWGTKGLDSESKGRTQDIVQNWKVIKLIYVAKYVFWNIIVGVFMLVISSPIVIGVLDFDTYQSVLAESYVRKFFVTFAVMALIFLTLIFKMIIGIMYMFKYRCCSSVSIGKQPQNIRKMKSRIDQYFEEMKPSIYYQIESQVKGLVSDIQKNGDINQITGMASLIMQNKSINKGKPRQRVIQNWNRSFAKRSEVVKKKKMQQPSNTEITFQADRKNENVGTSSGNSNGYTEQNPRRKPEGKKSLINAAPQSSSYIIKNDQNLPELNKKETNKIFGLF